MTDCMNIIIEIHRDIPIQADNFILVVRSIERRIPRKFTHQITGTDRNLKSLIPHLTRIDLRNIDIRIPGRDRHYHIYQHIVRILDISIQTKVDPTVNHCQVGTDIILLHLFPANIRVWHYRRSNGIHLRTIEVILNSLDGGGIRIITHTRLITGQSISRTEFHITQPETLFKERFLRKPPGKRYGREIRPPVLFAETGRTVTPDRSCQQVFIIVCIIDTP